MMSDPIELPPGLDLLWGRREATRRGPKPGLSIDAIVRAAIDLAHAEGLESVSMAKVAKAVGFTTMSLYRHVSSKDELLQLMWNASADGVEDFELTGDTWRGKLRSWSIAQREAIERNIWIVQMPMATPPLVPNSLTWMEKGFEALDGTGLPELDQMRIIGLCSSHALIDARMAFDARKATEANDGEAPVDYPALLRELADSERFPRLNDVVHSGRLDDNSVGDGPLAEYRADLEVILDGIEARILRQER